MADLLKLAGVIREALANDGRGVSLHWDKLPDHIAAAVAAHLESDAVVERMRAAHCRAGCPDATAGVGCQSECDAHENFVEEQADQMRAAIRAAVREA